MKLLEIIFAGLSAPVLLAVLTNLACAITITFDDVPVANSPTTGNPVPFGALITDRYESLGVIFDSAGGGIGIGVSGNPVSAPNVAKATAQGPIFSVSTPVVATFVANGGQPAVVDFVSIELSNSSSVSTLSAFDVFQNLLGSMSGAYSAPLVVSFPGEIHSIRIDQGPMVFDNFTYDGLRTVSNTVASDYNGNGTVDAADYVIWRKSRGQTGTGLGADGNSDGVVNAADYDYWRARFGQSAASGATADSPGSGSFSIPEPHALLLIASALYSVVSGIPGPTRFGRPITK